MSRGRGGCGIRRGARGVAETGADVRPVAGDPQKDQAAAELKTLSKMDAAKALGLDWTEDHPNFRPDASRSFGRP